MRTRLERGAVWVLTGPVGRVTAFFADVSVAWFRWASGRERRDREKLAAWLKAREAADDAAKESSAAKRRA